MKISKASLVYALICNAIVSAMLCLTAAVVANNHVDPISYLINFAVGYTIATLVGIFVPLVEIGKRFTRFWKVDAITFTGNRFYRFLAVCAINFVYFVIISPSLTILNYFLVPMTPMEAVLSWCRNALPLLSVGYVTSIVADKFSYLIAHKIDPNF